MPARLISPLPHLASRSLAKEPMACDVFGHLAIKLLKKTKYTDEDKARVIRLSIGYAFLFLPGRLGACIVALCGYRGAVGLPGYFGGRSPW